MSSVAITPHAMGLKTGYPGATRVAAVALPHSTDDTAASSSGPAGSSTSTPEMVTTADPSRSTAGPESAKSLTLGATFFTVTSTVSLPAPCSTSDSATVTTTVNGSARLAANE